MKVTRRSFLKIGGLSAATLFLGGCRFLAERGQLEVEEAPLAPENTIFHTCYVCDCNCHMILRLEGARIAEHRGNPKDEMGAAGRLCVKGYSGLRIVHDPDRLKAPLRRTNPHKGRGVDPGWEKITWDEAFKTVGAKFGEIIEKHGPEAIACFVRPKTWEMHLVNSLGTPNQFCHVDTCYVTHEVAWAALVSGKGRVWGYDYGNAKYIVSFGWDQPGKSNNIQLREFLKARAKGAKVVVFDPRLSVTAAKSDEWIPIKPGTDLAVALAMINVIVNEGLYDKTFVNDYCTGLDKLREGVKQYTPEWAAAISEVPATTISRIAREFATTRPATVAFHKRDAGGPIRANSFQMAQAIIILNALAGTVDRPGGVFYPRKPKLPTFDEVYGLKYPKQREERIDGAHKFKLGKASKKVGFSTAAEGILAGEPYQVKAALFCNYNLSTFPNPRRLEEALRKLDFVVVVDMFNTEVAQYADVVLPSDHFLESSGYTIREYNAYRPQVLLDEPVPRAFDTKGWAAIVNGILKATPGREEFAVDPNKLKEAELAAMGLTLEGLKKADGVWDSKAAFVPKKEFGTPSKKIELYSSALAKEKHAPVPEWVAPLAQPTSAYPYYFVVNHLPWMRMCKNSNDPVLMALQPENYCYMHPSVARSIGVKDGDAVVVESPYGFIRLKAKTTEGIRPDTVMTEHGFGLWGPGRTVAKNRGANDGDVMKSWSPKEMYEKTHRTNAAMGHPLIDFTVNVRKA
jgi:thiosulfate reductase/polysulfide reductase chain A